MMILVVLAVAAGAVVAEGQGESEAAAQPESGTDGGLAVFVSIQPQKYFVERIAGDAAEVSVMVPPGKEPHSYEPTPRQVAALSEADVYFRIGVPFEQAFIPRIERSLEDLPVVDISANIEKRRLAAHDHDHGDEGHDHDHEGEDHDHEEHDHEGEDHDHDHEEHDHDHEGDDHHHEGEDHDHDHDHEAEGAIDPHVWLGPLEVRAMAAEIRDTLVSISPENADAYRENYAELAADIDELHARLSDQLAPFDGETMFVFHPAFGYFADTYGLEQEAVETGGNEPSPAQLERIIEEAQEEGVRVIFVQPQFSQDSAQRVAQAIDGAVVPINPLAEDWLSNMQTIADRIEEGLR
jgi:zinc transport system substrate-binding protein